MSTSKLPPYTGVGKQRPDAHAEAPPAGKPEPYVPDAELVRAVRLAMFLKRPLLLEGEPGCGKTRLAYAVAYELGIPIERWNITSGSRAKDGLYEYDAVLRLHDVQLEKKGLANDRDPARSSDYVRYGAIGKAFRRTDTRTVVLIDEIDKADVDFANDLLNVIDRESAIPIPELGEHLGPAEGCEPIYIITSNREKGNLPDPFLRRCLYRFVSFPEKEQLSQIVKIHWKNKFDKDAPAAAEEAATRFDKVRGLPNLQKKPGTSEFLDWLHAIDGFDDGLVKWEAQLREGELPYPEVLIKVASDLRPALAPPTP
ncbi:AAA family ATPase [Fimbriimonas ginsengisoli]|uniref:ATPase, AAA family n=1 Tax=Fimbriimonas ginsengisoli Gsoil 348 TaxID=661478 RepID=A0A068NJH4_FIMGI|nr:MoxR family ATPase [Fimbriimonas ginsengisoli]AIE83768.1 ATPase, AAA family [Fimbriimonas ginsengisoli Gsoil 348]